MTTPTSIVEDLWNRIRLAIDDKILNALNYKNAAESANTSAQAAKTAAEKAAGDAAGAAKAEVDKLVAGAPAAFDTLKEIATELSENETERSALTTAIGKKLDATDVSVSTGTNGKVPRREPTSDNIRVGNVPTENYHLTNKSYVDTNTVKASAPGMTLWTGTQVEYDALPSATRNAPGFIAVIY